MTASSPRMTPRVRPRMSAREMPARIQPAWREALAASETELTRRFVGITTDGRAVPDLFGPPTTPASTQPITAAAVMLLQVLSEVQRTTVQFALDSDEWRRWHNTAWCANWPSLVY